MEPGKRQRRRASGQGARARRDVLWLPLDTGSPRIVLEGATGERAAMQLSLPFKPHRVEVSAAGWRVAGVHEDGLADDNLQFTRTESTSGQPGQALQPTALPPIRERRAHPACGA